VLGRLTTIRRKLFRLFRLYRGGVLGKTNAWLIFYQGRPRAATRDCCLIASLDVLRLSSPLFEIALVLVRLDHVAWRKMRSKAIYGAGIAPSVMQS
jgi:hypothetical protein